MADRRYALLGHTHADLGTASAWGDLTGTLSDQTDLQTALDLKADATAIANASDWDTAFGWGNHAVAGYGTGSGDATLADAETVTGAWTFDASTTFNGIVNIRGGNNIILRDSTNADAVEMKHDGSNFQINDLGGTAVLRVRNMGLQVEDGNVLRVQDAGDTDWAQFQHDGTNFGTSFVNTSDWNITGADIQLLGGQNFAVYNSSNTAIAIFDHDGTDFNTTLTNTTDWNITGGRLNVPSGGNIPSPILPKDISYTLVLSDGGKTIYKASGGAGETITIPANTSVAFPTGTLIAFQNDGGGDLSIAITTDTLKGTDGTTGTKTLSDDNTAVIQKVTSTLWKYTATDL